MKRSSSKPLLLTAMALAVGIGDLKTPVYADAIGLEEVIVTAQRREENSQDVAISVTVFNQEQVSNMNMVTSADIATYTPSLSAQTRFGADNASFSIRGFTQDLRTAASVGTYFAEVVAPRGQVSQTSGDGAGPGTLFDLANIQVLKGPQGTLFGRNTTGGAILLTPQKPTDEFEGYVEGSIGDYGSQREQLIINAPLSDNFKMRLGIDHNERDGHLENFTKVGADALGNTDYTAYRLSLLWNPSDTIENYTILTYTDSDSYGSTSTAYACNPNSPAQGNLFGPFTQQPCMDQLARQAAAGKDGFYDIVSTVKTPVTAIEEKRFINTLTWDAAENLTVKGILAYAHLETMNGSDIFGTQFTESAASQVANLSGFNGIINAFNQALPVGSTPIAAITGPTPTPDPRREFVTGVSTTAPSWPVTSSETWVGEVQLQGLTLNGLLDWQAGLYYENTKPDGFSGNVSGSFLSCELATLEGDPSGYNCYDPTGGLLGGVIQQRFETEFLNQAAYFQGTVSLIESLSLTVGLRYTKDETKGHGRTDRYNFVDTVRQDAIVAITNPEVSSSVPTGMIELNYRPLNDVMVYAKYTRGYRQGSVNLAADPGLDTHDYETVDTYEIGAKTEFGGPIPGRFNIAAFSNKLKDMQLQAGYISATSGPTTAITNAGEAEINGFEIESQFILAEGLRLSLSYSYLDTELLEQGQVNPQTIADAVSAASARTGADPVTAELQGQVAAQTYTPIAVVGDTLPYAAESAWVASLNYQLPVARQIGIITLGATYSYNGDMRTSASGSSIGNDDVIDAYALLNLNASWLAIMGSNFDLSLYATNVTDEEYVNYVAGVYSTLGYESRQVGMPAMVGGRLRYSF